MLHVDMDPKMEKDCKRDACKFLMRKKKLSSRQAERVMNMKPRNGMEPWEFNNDRR